MSSYEIPRLDRVWKGKREFGDIYFVGQQLITEGRLKGCYRQITEEYATEEQVYRALGLPLPDLCERCQDYAVPSNSFGEPLCESCGWLGDTEQ